MCDCACVFVCVSVSVGVGIGVGACVCVCCCLFCSCFCVCVCICFRVLSVSVSGVSLSMSVPVPEFECGIFLAMHLPGIPMSSHWSREDGGDVGWLYFGDRFVVTEVSMSHSGGRVRGLVAKVDGSTGWISMYSTRSYQQFVVSMEGEPPWSRVRDLFPPLHDRALQVWRSAAITGEHLSDASSGAS